MSEQVPNWLNPQERAAWLSLLEISMRMPGELDSRLQREAGMTLFEYHVLAMLSEVEGYTLPMTALSELSYSSLSRLSHVVKKLEARGYVTRRRSGKDARVTVVELTDAGASMLKDLAPTHVADVRDLVFDSLDERDVADLSRIGRKLVAHADPENWTLSDGGAATGPVPPAPKASEPDNRV
ncbi:MAG: MarR family winged helix-turn-helix transcriptional regulator [Galactobacter sp.]